MSLELRMQADIANTLGEDGLAVKPNKYTVHPRLADGERVPKESGGLDKLARTGVKKKGALDALVAITVAVSRAATDLIGGEGLAPEQVEHV